MTVNRCDVTFVIGIILYVIVFLGVLPLATAISVSVSAGVEGEGFHRTLNYHVDTGNFNNKSCNIAVFVQLPTAVYANVDELADLRRTQKISACSSGEIDVELFAEKAYYQNITLCSRLTSTKITLSVPVHQRYYFATPNGEPYNVTIPQPKLLIGCRDRLKEHRVSKIKIRWPCIELAKKWRDVDYQWGGDGGFIWQIPVGNTSRKFEVTCVTLFVTLSGAAYVLWTIYKSYKVPKDKKKDN